MLQSAEIFPNARRVMRRGVAQLESELIASSWDQPRRHRILDLSERGMRVAAGTRLVKGEHLVLSFVPPGWWLHGELTLFARVARSTERTDGAPASMGLEFLDLPNGAARELARCLRGLPPPLPIRQRSPHREMVWVDVLLTHVEDLGDRVNTFEVSERIRLSDLERALEPVSLGGLVTGGRGAYRWQHDVERAEA